MVVADTQFSLSVQNAINRPGAKAASMGTGLENVRRRLALIYPQAHSLQIQEDNGIFSVLLDLSLAPHTEACQSHPAWWKCPGFPKLKLRLK